MIPKETVELVTGTARIEEVVSDYVSLKRRGANFTACCPFHEEKTPSFSVSPSKGIFKCFGCGKAGSSVHFIMEMEHCSYFDAIRHLAKKYNIEIQEREATPEEIQQRERKESLMLVAEFATKFYIDALKSEEGRRLGYAYLRGRGLEDSTIEKFQLGWAPSGGMSLVSAARSKGFKDEYLIATGLAYELEDGRVVDRFRERAMFPIFTISGRPIAYSGRTLRTDGKVAKYVNSPETEIYTKGNTLLGIYLAKEEITRRNECILVEGNLDMVMMYQHGIKNVVASCGTALTQNQVTLIKRFAQNVIIMYDGDAAGIHAVERGIPLLLSEGLNVRIVLLPEGEDPDSFCRKHTLDEVQQYIEDKKVDFITFMVREQMKSAGSDPIKRAERIDTVARYIARVPDRLQRQLFIQQTVDISKVDISTVSSYVERYRVAPSNGSGSVTAKEGSVAQVEENAILAPVERDILQLLLRYGCEPLNFESDSQFYVQDENERPTVADFINNSFEDDDVRMANSLYARIYDAYFDMYYKGLLQDEILAWFYRSEEFASAVMSISEDKYPITIESFNQALTAVSSWLVKTVPYTLILYMAKRLEDSIAVKMNALDRDPDGAIQLMKEIQDLRAKLLIFNRKIGREK